MDKNGIELPEGEFTLAVAVEMIPMTSLPALYVFLFNNKKTFEPHYRNLGINSRRGMVRTKRMLTTSEILQIRRMLTVSNKESKYYRRSQNILAKRALELNK